MCTNVRMDELDEITNLFKKLSKLSYVSYSSLIHTISLTTGTHRTRILITLIKL